MKMLCGAFTSVLWVKHKKNQVLFGYMKYFSYICKEV